MSTKSSTTPSFVQRSIFVLSLSFLALLFGACKTLSEAATRRSGD